jgi:hypothetical protein
MIRSVLRVLAVCLPAATIFAAEPPPFYLHDGDRVVFYGDSITDPMHCGDAVQRS